MGVGLNCRVENIAQSCEIAGFSVDLPTRVEEKDTFC